MSGFQEVKRGYVNGYVGMVQMYLLMSGSVGTDNPFFDSSYAKRVGLDPEKLDKEFKDDYQGYLDAMDSHWVDTDFGPGTEEALFHYQARHMDRNGEYLIDVEEGIVGPETWYSFKNRSETESDVKVVPDNVEVEAKSGDTSNPRYAVAALAYSYLGIGEDPKGSNRGKEVDYFKGNTRRWAWCQCFVGRVYKDVTGLYPVGPESKPSGNWRNDPGTARCRGYAKELGYFKAKRLGCKVGDPDAPEIGDMYSVYYGGGRGHTGFVVGLKIVNGVIVGVYTLSGNENDAVTEGYRALSSRTLVGFIDPYAEAVVLPEFDRDFGKVKDSSSSKTR